jgi:hypothetical protein
VTQPAPIFYADFGALTHSVQVDRAMIRHMQKWLPTYLAAAEAREGRPKSWLARPAMYSTVYDEDDEDFLSDKRMPTVFVTSLGFTDWERTGDGLYSAACAVRVSYVSRGRNPVEARLQASLNIAAVTELLLSKPDLGGFANGVHPVSERPRPILDPSNRSRHLAAGMGEYAVMVPDIRSIMGGPIEPDPPPDPLTDPVGLPDVSQVDVDVQGYSPPSPPEG